MTSSSQPCPHCRVSISVEATICPQCRSAVAVELRLIDAVSDGRLRYRIGRALQGLDEGVPAFSELQSRLAVRGGPILGNVSRALAERVQAVFEAEHVPTRIQASAGRATPTARPRPRQSASGPRIGIGIGIAAVAFIVAGGAVVWKTHRGASSSPAASPAQASPVLSQTRVAEVGLAATVALSCSEGGGGRRGSGFFVDRDVIVTNAHVLCPGNSSVKVRFSDGHEVVGTVERSQETLDLAVVRAPGLRGAPLSLGDAGALKVGEKLTFVGSPVGMEFSVHQGSVSSVDRRDLGVAYIQVDAQVNPGNSGGPLIDERGRVVGVVTLKVNADGIGLAVPINYLHTGSDALLPRIEGPRSPAFERAAARAANESREMASDLVTNGSRPGLVGAQVRGPLIVVSVLWPSTTEPPAQSFTFHFWRGEERVCSFDGVISGWNKIEAKGGGSPLPPRIKGWLASENITLDLYVGEGGADWSGCSPEQLRGGPVEMEMEGADPEASRVTFS